MALARSEESIFVSKALSQSPLGSSHNPSSASRRPGGANCWKGALSSNATSSDDEGTQRGEVAFRRALRIDIEREGRPRPPELALLVEGVELKEEHVVGKPEARVVLMEEGLPQETTGIPLRIEPSRHRLPERARVALVEELAPFAQIRFPVSWSTTIVR